MILEPRIPIDHEKIAAFCQKWKIIEFSLFGSVLRDDFGPDSDVDVLVTFAPTADRTVWDFIAAREELETIFRREVSLVERKSVERSRNYLRRNHILKTAQQYYVS
jgi:predicted nucleotidyltransferase